MLVVRHTDVLVGKLMMRPTENITHVIIHYRRKRVLSKSYFGILIFVVLTTYSYTAGTD